MSAQQATPAQLGVRKLRSTKTALKEGEQMIQIRTMTGEDEYALAVKETVTAHTISRWVSKYRGLYHPTDIVLAIDCEVLKGEETMQELKPQLEKTGNIFQMLVTESVLMMECCPSCEYYKTGWVANVNYPAEVVCRRCRHTFPSMNRIE
jgi:hypothetical protein